MKKAFQQGLLCFLSLCLAGPCAAGVPLEPLKKAPEISSPVWFNVESFPRISLKSLRGDVVLVFFWSYLDRYSRDAIKVINNWYERYQDKGFVVIGVHSMEWEFDMSEATVDKAVKTLNIKFPVVLDMDGRIGMKYGEPFHPALFFVDRKGILRAQFMVGYSWPNAETFLRALLEEGHSRLLDKL